LALPCARAPRIGGTASAANRTHGMLRRLARIAFWVISGFVVGSILLVTLYRYLPPPGTPLMLLRRVEGYGIHKSWISFDQISANLVRAVIASEDTRFCNHHGFDWNAIETAWDRYRSRRGRLLGASTISMQTAKNVFLWPRGQKPDDLGVRATRRLDRGLRPVICGIAV
jgi:monofunctional glycosyltransferase